MSRREKSEATLASALSIAEEYGGNLTVRQLYYQLVARGYIPNSQESYKRLVSLLGDARLAGDFPFEWILDRTREARPGRFKGNQVDVHSALDSAASDLRRAPEAWLWRDRWYGQPCHVSVWVEKEALAGVFERPCESLGVAWFVLRGYSSLSALSEWVDHVAAAYSRWATRKEQANNRRTSIPKNLAKAALHGYDSLPRCPSGKRVLNGEIAKLAERLGIPAGTIKQLDQTRKREVRNAANV